MGYTTSHALSSRGIRLKSLYMVPNLGRPKARLHVMRERLFLLFRPRDYIKS